MTIADLLQVLRKHLPILIVTAAVVFAAVAAYTFLRPPTYTATAQLFASYSGNTDSDSAPNSSDINTGTSYISTQIKTYPQLVKTEAVLQPVVDDLGLNMTTSELASMVTASNPTNTFLVEISVDDGNAKDSATIANAVANSLEEQISSDLYSEVGESPIQLTLVQKAQTPTSPSSPKVTLYLAVGLVLALIVGVMAALLADVLNTKVDNAEDVRLITDASPLGVVVKSDNLNAERPVIASEPYRIPECRFQCRGTFARHCLEQPLGGQDDHISQYRCRHCRG